MRQTPAFPVHFGSIPLDHAPPRPARNAGTSMPFREFFQVEHVERDLRVRGPVAA
jgi:hypothetical protein